MSIYLCALCNKAKALNDIALIGLLGSSKIKFFEAEDYKNNKLLMNTLRLQIFRKETNFLNNMTYRIRTKVIFLTNSILSSKGITNESLGIITTLL